MCFHISFNTQERPSAEPQSSLHVAFCALVLHCELVTLVSLAVSFTPSTRQIHLASPEFHASLCWSGNSLSEVIWDVFLSFQGVLSFFAYSLLTLIATLHGVLIHRVSYFMGVYNSGSPLSLYTVNISYVINYW